MRANRDDQNQETLESTELMIRTDGRILARNLTPAVAAILAELNPNDAEMQLRAAEGLSGTTSSMHPEI